MSKKRGVKRTRWLPKKSREIVEEKSEHMHTYLSESFVVIYETFYICRLEMMQFERDSASCLRSVHAKTKM